MEDEREGIEASFSIDFHDSFGQLKSLDDAFGSATANAIREWQRVQSITKTLGLGSATTEVKAFGSAYEREMQAAAQSSKQVERSIEGMIRQLTRQAETYGMTTAQARAFRAEQKAIEADSVGLTEAAARLRAVSAEMIRLDGGMTRAGASVGGTRFAMQGLSYQAQDTFTQLSMGANPLNVLAIQGGQAAGQMAGLGGKMGAVASFMMGPWGIALTGATLLLGYLTKGLFDGAKAADEVKFATNALGDAQNILSGVMDMTTGKINTQNSALIALAKAQLLVAQVQAKTRAAEARRGVEDIKYREMQLGGGMGGGFSVSRRSTDARDYIAQQVLQGKMEGDVAVERLENLRKIGRLTDEQFTAAATSVANLGLELNNIKEFEAAERVMKGVGTRSELSRFLKPDRADKPDKRDKVDSKLSKELAEQKREYDALVDKAEAYTRAQKDQAATLGMTAQQLRTYRDAAAIAEAPTTALKDAIIAQAAARERAFAAENARQFARGLQSGDDQLAKLKEEIRLIGAGNIERVEALALLRATQEARAQEFDPAQSAAYIAQQVEIARETEKLATGQDRYNASLTATADQWDQIAQQVQSSAQVMSEAFGGFGRALGDVAAIYATYRSEEERAIAARNSAIAKGADEQREYAKFDLASSRAQMGLYGDMASAAKGFFKEKSAGYKAIMAAEKVFRAFEFAMSVRSMVQDISETISSVANSGARATAAGAEGMATQAKLPFPLNIAAMAATAAALVAAGISILGSPGGGANGLPQSNTGTGSVLGDGSAQSESIKNAISALREVDLLMLNSSRQMAASLKSIESNIGSFASLLVRNADSINASGGVAEGFNASGLGSILGKIPLIGGILKGLFGTTTSVIGSGLYGDSQSVGSILNGGFDAQYYSDVQKKRKFLGITTSNKFSTQYTGADANLENQFTLILRSFNEAILAAAGPLGASTNEIQQKLNGFVLNIGKIDLKGLTGVEIEEKLTAVFGAAADNMARAAFPMIDAFQKVGEGAFETLVRVASTIEAVGASFDMLGQNATSLSIAAKLGLADQFDSISALTGAVDEYFQRFYTKEEQAAARTAQLASVFQSLGLTLPSTLAGFRSLVEAQNLNTTAGQAAYATLLQLAPAFADLQTSMVGAKSAADIASERMDLQRQLLELQGDTAALRALQLAKVDASNRELQQQIWAIQDAQAAAKAADELRKAWQSVGDSIMDEVRRIRGLTDAGGGNTFAALMGQFNAASTAARGGDIDAAKTLPQLSQTLLAAAADAATSRQELDRVRAQIAASLEGTNGLIGMLAGRPAASNASSLETVASNQPTRSNLNDNDALSARLDTLAAKLEQLIASTNAGNLAIASGVNKIGRKLEDVTSQSGGDAISVVSAA